jgi:hypothetical protein
MWGLITCGKGEGLCDKGLHVDSKSGERIKFWAEAGHKP